jgi:hypothetical protein
MAYIPRSSLDKSGTSSSIPKIVKKKRTFRVFGFLGTTLLILSVAATGGVFFYKSYVEDQVEGAKQALYLAEQKRGDSDAKIQEIKTYDTQLSVAEKLLNQHLAPSKVFDVLEMYTKETVQFKTFSYEYNPGFEAFLTLGGATKEFSSVVLQKNQFDTSSLDSPYEVTVFEGITRSQSAGDDEGAELYEDDEVRFDVTGILRSDQVTYTGTPAQRESDDLTDEDPLADDVFEGDDEENNELDI